MDKYKKLVSNTAILSVGTLASKILVYLLLPLYTDCLSPSEYSTADLISQTANLLLPLLAVGMVDGIFRFAIDSESDGGRNKVFCVSTYMVAIGSVIALALIPLLELTGFFEGYSWLIPLYVIASNFHLSAAHFLRGSGKTKLFSLQGIICTALTIALNLLFLLVFDMGVTGYVLSVVVSDALMTVFLYTKEKLWKFLRPSNFESELLKKMIKYSVPMIPTTVFWWITNVADRYMIAYFDGDYINGLYAVAFKVPTLLILVSGIFSEAWQYSAVTDGSGEDRQRFFSRVFDSFQSIVFLAASFLILFAKFFTRVLLADTYADAWQYMPVLVAATVFSSLVTFMSSVYVKHKRSMNSFITAMIGALANIILNLILIPKYSAQGAAVATLACYIIVYIIRAVDTQRYEKFDTKPITMIANSLIVGFQCITMLLEVRFWWICGIISVIALCIVNFRALFSSVKTVLGSVFGRLRH
ncbi:MAG: polysaccharide biosynthesis C-terminal domain-containing protein [Clostridia bacterium]|nr:polysaccharide biosynthesis C-terminal domain-containing protein [Clostridia bacterium]